MDKRLKQIISEVCQERQAIIIAMEVMPDHVHLLVDINLKYWDLPSDQADQRPLLVSASEGASRIERNVAHTLDKFLFRNDNRTGNTENCEAIC
jgi:hypothetical protein